MFFFDRVFSVGEGNSVDDDDGGTRPGLPRSNDSIANLGRTEPSKESGVARPENDGWRERRGEGECECEGSGLLSVRCSCAVSSESDCGRGKGG